MRWLIPLLLIACEPVDAALDFSTDDTRAERASTLAAVRRTWERHPHLTLGQLMVIVSGNEDDTSALFTMEDERLRYLLDRCEDLDACVERAKDNP